jgi:hypothetical protein
MMGTELAFVKPETVAAIQADPFAMQALKATRDFLQAAHRDFSRLGRDGAVIFHHDEAGIAWHALGVLGDIQDNDLPSDTTVNIGGVCMNIGSIRKLQEALRDGAKRANSDFGASVERGLDDMAQGRVNPYKPYGMRPQKET